MEGWDERRLRERCAEMLNHEGTLGTVTEHVFCRYGALRGRSVTNDARA